jgi:hypothetical protein
MDDGIIENDIDDDVSMPNPYNVHSEPNYVLDETDLESDEEEDQ